MPTPVLPIETALPRLVGAVSHARKAVLVAPPGAGKTTRVPLALMDSGTIDGRIVMLEPRRLAARAAAERMAESLGERPGQTVGYRIRGETRAGPQTRIEVVTEGILTRMIQSEPDLPGIGALLFDEFHERSLHADLGLALALEAKAALRTDLVLVVMSATLDPVPVAALMGGAPVVTCQGRSHPVETRWAARPVRRDTRPRRLEAGVADTILEALAQTEGGLLAFLPGAGEIRRTAAFLKPRLPAGCILRPLYGALDFATQRAAIRPETGARKVVLATSIAETSLTIEDIRVVVDGGYSRRARFDPGSGMSRLVSERSSRAEADQRRGRAGRVAPGVCYRVWSEAEHGARTPFPAPEIAAADLAPLVLECAIWGERQPARLPFATTPPQPAVKGARELLQSLGALDAHGAATAHGRQMARLPLHPRLAHMVLRGGRDAPRLAALLEARDLLAGSDGPDPGTDIALRLDALRNPARFRAETGISVDRARHGERMRELGRLPRGKGAALSTGAMAALAFPDRIGLRRPGGEARFLLANGKGAYLADPADALAEARLIVAADLDGDRREARIRLAATLDETEMRRLFSGELVTETECRWSSREAMVKPVRRERFGALVLGEAPWRDCPPERITAAMAEGLRAATFDALPLTPAAKRLLARISWARAEGANLPDSSPEALMASIADWLGPALGACRRLSDLAPKDLGDALESRLGHSERRELEAVAPARFTAPTGTRLPIDYGRSRPTISVRLQEMFGLSAHPVVGRDGVPLLVELLSPAGRPVQTTADLPGFWTASYGDVRKEMRGRYPKHFWPENPAEAAPTRRAKPPKKKKAPR